MIPTSPSETTLSLRVFQILTVTAPVLFFAIASIVSSFSATQPSKAGEGRLHKAQLSLALVATVLSAAEAAVDLEKSDPSKISDPDAVYALFLTLVYVILSIGLVDDNAIASYPHHGAWAILLVCQGTVFALSIPGASSTDKLLLARGLFQGLQLAVTLILLAGSLLIRYLQHREHKETEDETRPLLAGEASATGPAVSSETKELDDDEVDRLRIRNRPFWQYVSSFKVFVPYMYPKSPKLQLYFTGMCIFSAGTRVVIIALPLTLGALVNRLGDSVPWKPIAVFVLLKFLTSSAGVPLIETWLSYRLNIDLAHALQRHCYDHIMNLSADFHDNKKSSVIWQVMNQGQDVIDLFHDMLFEFVPQMIDLISAAVVLTCLFGLYMTFIVATTAILYYWLTFKALITKRSLRRSWLDAYHDQYYQMSESTLNWSTVCYFGRIPHELRKYQEKGDITRGKMLMWWSWEFWTRGLRNIVPCATFAAACIVAALQIARRQLNVGDFVILITYWSQLTGPLSSIAGELSRLTEMLVNAEKLVVLLEKTPHVQDLALARPFTFLEGAVQFENVSFSYDGKRQVTKGITFRAAPGTTIALVGQTGGGKSTILRLLFRFYDVDQGRILVDGQDIRHVKMESFRKHIAMVPQNPVVFNMSILENVRYPDIDCTDEEAIEACKAAALHDKVMSFTKGYQEKVGERGTKLSGGELQRLAIARAILKKADILLLDEATSAVDSITEKTIQASIRQLCAGKTAFVIAHRLSTILHADHILVIRDGQIIEAGSHETLIKQDGAYNELWRSQLRLQADERSRSRSRSPQKSYANVLVNDLNSSGEESQTLVKSLSRSSKDRKTSEQAHADDGETSSIYENDQKARDESHANADGRGRTLSKRFAGALSRRMSRPKSPKKGQSSDSGLNPDARTFRPSRSKSPQKDGSSESALKPDVRTFRPRRFQDGQNSTSFSEDAPSIPEVYLRRATGEPLNQIGSTAPANNENSSKASPVQAVFQLKRKWAGHGRETLDSSEDPGEYDVVEATPDADDAQSERPEALVEGIEGKQIKFVSGYVRRRQTASEPFPESVNEEDDSEDSLGDGNIMHSAKYSRLPQMPRGRAVSAVERKAIKEQGSGERSPDDREPRAPVNTAATSPGVLTPKSNQKFRSNFLA
jgi:ABC-type transport system involved in Fe-S cluster assembly fused permease/ATPase subunit